MPLGSLGWASNFGVGVNILQLTSASSNYRDARDASEDPGRWSTMGGRRKTEENMENLTEKS